MNPATLDTTSHPAGAPPRLLIVRLGAMGDIVHTLPAVAALRCGLPASHIGWLVEERWRELLCAHDTPLSGARSAGRPLVDAVHVVKTHAWRKTVFAADTRRAAVAALHEIRDAHYKIAIDFQGAIKSALLAQFSGTPQRVGFRHPRETVASLFYTRAVMTEGRHVVQQNLALAAALHPLPPPGAAVPQFPLPFDPEAEAWCDAQFGTRAYAAINPGAGWGAKCWPVERYAEVARALAAEGLTVLANVGPDEHELGRLLQAVATPVTCSVGQLIALCRRARLVIGGDTGPLHLAAALGVPVVGVYGPTDPVRNGPTGAPSVVLRSTTSHTSHRRRGKPEAGLLNISAAEVIAAARTLLREVAR